MRAVAVLQDNEVAGIVGLARSTDYAYLFSEYRETLQPYLKSVIIMRAVKAAMRFVEGYTGTVYTIARQDEGKRLVERLGFVETEDRDLFIWLGTQDQEQAGER